VSLSKAPGRRRRAPLRARALLALVLGGCALGAGPPLGDHGPPGAVSLGRPLVVRRVAVPGPRDDPGEPAGQAQEPARPPQAAPAAPPPGAGGEARQEGEGKEKGEKEGKEKKESTPWYSVHEQGTVVTQKHPPFRSPYVGPHSLVPEEPAATTETATLFAAARLWPGGEVVFNPEVAGGRGLSGTQGVAGFPNGEATRVGVPEPTPYIARLFFRQTWGLGGSWEKAEDMPNQIAGPRDIDRVTLTVGKMSAGDIADNNRYSHDPRTQFLNWSLMYNGAWDYPANVRGYTYGIALELNTVFWALHYGIFAEPAVANGAEFDPRFLKANGQVLEVEEHWGIGDHPGKLRELFYLNHAHMGNYREALALMPVDPDVTLTRAYRFKYGFGLNLEQEITRDLGLFARAGWNDGHSESWAFTEIDRTASVGLVLKGRHWRRPDDEVGLAGVINGLSGPHRDYLAAGGLGFIIGDGRLNYAPEQIVEAYYNWQVVKGINVTFDFQGINHPAYNADRGPVAVGTIRVHFEH
jgi:high affinity Mn2+ porin